MKINERGLHRDIAYFYVGLIISFSISGIALNHRRTWNPQKYTYEKKQVEYTIPQSESEINDQWLQQFSTALGVDQSIRKTTLEDGEFKVFYEYDVITIDAKTGKGEQELIRRIPVLGQMSFLHITTEPTWIWYSDIFGLAMLTIAITGMFISKGKFSFTQRGWKLSLLGIIFPFVILYFFT
ncbi:MAG: PepSY-associated TM helix domain-containing protein [Cyclobacteriaceae bacterium]